MSTGITDLKARQVWDSRGRPTIEVEVRLEGGAHGRAIAPSGASTGSREALDRRDGGRRLGGFGVNGALADLDAVVRPALLGRDATDQAAIDRLLIDLDGTPQKSRLGGNAIVATSCAVAWAAADAARQPLWRHLRELAGAPVEQRWVPTPMIQIFGGGRHAGGRIDIQDYLVLCPGASSFAEAVEWTAEIYMAASSLLARKGLHGVADEGGIWPDFSRNEDGLSYLQQAIEMAGFKPLTDVGIALDVAATSFWHEGRYRLALENRLLDSAQMIDLLAGWCASFPILSIEDPLGEDDTEGFIEFTRRMGSRIQIVGDDYLTTNAASILEAGRTQACNAVLLKANQCGTVSEVIAAVNASEQFGMTMIQSGRSGESEDVTLSHLAVGLRSHQIKVGSMTRSERTAKWNEVIRIEESYPAPRLSLNPRRDGNG